MNRRGFIAALAALPVAGLVGLGVMRRGPAFYGMSVAEVIALLQESYRNAMIYGTSFMRVDWERGRSVLVDRDLEEPFLRALRKNTRVVPLGRLDGRDRHT